MPKKGKFIEQLNKTFAKSDFDFIIEYITDEIQWEVIRNFPFHEKEEFIEVIRMCQAKRTQDNP